MTASVAHIDTKGMTLEEYRTIWLLQTSLFSAICSAVSAEFNESRHDVNGYRIVSEQDFLNITHDGVIIDSLHLRHLPKIYFKYDVALRIQQRIARIIDEMNTIITRSLADVKPIHVHVYITNEPLHSN